MKLIEKKGHYIVFIFFSISVFFKPFGSGDELWNYNFARCIAHGLKPYTDISIVQTPLSAYVSSLFLLLFEDGLFSFRIAGFVLMILTELVLYKLCLETSKSRTLAFVSTAFIFALHLLMWIYNYNYVTVMLTLFVMLLFQSEKLHDNRIALIFGLFPLIKQNTGAILLLAFLVICLLELVYEKKNKRIILRKCIIAVLPTILYMIYLTISGSFMDFWEYAVLGIATFTHRTSYISFALSNPIWFIFALIPWMVFGLAVYDFIKHGYDGRKVRCVIVCAASMSLAYPLCDASHFCTAIIPLIPLWFLFLRVKTIKMSSAIVCNLVAVMVMVVSVLGGTTIFSDEYAVSKINNYEYIPIKQSFENGIDEIDEYIIKMQSAGYEVFIADESAAAYKIPLDSYQKNWDMLLIGNIGSSTCQTLLETNSPSIYLVMRDNAALSKQAHFELINYIKDNYTYIDEVLYFDVYRKD